MQAVAGPAVHSSLAAVSEYYSTTMEAAKGASSSCMLAFRTRSAKCSAVRREVFMFMFIYDFEFEV